MKKTQMCSLENGAEGTPLKKMNDLISFNNSIDEIHVLVALI